MQKTVTRGVMPRLLQLEANLKDTRSYNATLIKENKILTRERDGAVKTLELLRRDEMHIGKIVKAFVDSGALSDINYKLKADPILAVKDMLELAATKIKQLSRELSSIEQAYEIICNERQALIVERDTLLSDMRVDSNTPRGHKIREELKCAMYDVTGLFNDADNIGQALSKDIIQLSCKNITVDLNNLEELIFGQSEGDEV